MTLIDQHNIEHAIQARAGGFRRGSGGARGKTRYTFDGATHKSGSPIRFHSVDKLIRWAKNERKLALKRM